MPSNVCMKLFFRDLNQTTIFDYPDFRICNPPKLGRPKGSGSSKLDPFREEIEAMLKCGVRQNYIAKKYDITPAALNQWIKKHGISTKAEVTSAE